jgi:ATP-dependent exoDNAse (exonuclease V) alpha subunit
MASYHLSAQPVKRSEGRSVVAMAAYRAGVRLKDERRDNEADYRRRKGIAHTEIMVPEGAAEWLADRERLWNYVERIENRRDAQLAREINMALPHELTDAERVELVRTFVRQEFVSRGMVVDFAIHKPVPEKGDDPRNYHAHLLLTLRQAEAKGLRRVKTREWNSDTMLVAWREAWAKFQNEALRRHGHKATVDHRSLAAQKADVVIVDDPQSKERILEIDVRGKRGVSYCKSTTGAVAPSAHL